MKAVIAVVMLAVGIVLGFSAGLLIRDPSVVTHPRTLLEPAAPTSCRQVIRAADDLAQIDRDYLGLVRQSYLPMLEQQNAEQPPSGSAGMPASPAAAPSLDAMLAASRRLADLSDRTASATTRLDQSRGQCESRLDQ